MNDKVSKLNAVVAWIKSNTVSKEDLHDAVKQMASIFSIQRDEFQKVSDTTIQKLNDRIRSFDEKALSVIDKSEEAYIKSRRNEEEIISLKEKLIEVENIEIPKIPDIDFEKIKKELANEIPEKETKEIVAEINNLPEVPEYQIDASHIKNLPKPGTVFTGGGRRGINQVNSSNVQISDTAKVLNFTGTAVSSVTEANNTVTVSLASGGSPLSGNPYAVGYFNALGNDLSSTSTYFEYDPSALYLKLIGENFTETGSLYTGIQGGYTIQVYDNIIESIDTRYVIANPATFSSGISANIGSWGTDGVDFLIKESSDDLAWAIPSSTKFVQTADKTIINSSAETTIIGTGEGSLTFPADYFTVGKTIKIHIHGYHSSDSNPLITLKIKLNSTVVVTDAVASGNGTNDGFYIHAEIVFRTVGSTGTVSVGGHFEETHSGGATIGLVQAGTTTIDTTIAQTLDVTWTWGVADIRNTVTSQVTLIEVLKAF